MDDVFYIDVKDGVNISYHQLIEDVRNTSVYNPYCKEESYYEVFKNIVTSLVIGEEIILLDADFTDVEVRKLEEMIKMDCIFCKIIKGDIPSYTIYEDDIVKVFLDVNPMSPGHMLIIPKKHFENLDDIDIDTLTHINEIAKKMHILLKEKLNIDGMSIIQNNGDVQEVKHYHMHLKPYYKENNGISVEEVYKKLIG